LILRTASTRVEELHRKARFELPASLFVSDQVVRQGLGQAIRDIKKKIS